MKKYLLVLVLAILVLTGCSFGKRTPSDKVRDFLDRYRNNDTVVVNELNDYLSSESLTDDERDEYRDVYLRQYTNLDYEIKDEVINGDDAVVSVQVTVYDYYKSNIKSDEYFNNNGDEFTLEDGTVDTSKYFKYKLKNLLDTTDTVQYLIEFRVSKVDDEWQVQPLSMDDLSKLHGTYEY